MSDSPRAQRVCALASTAVTGLTNVLGPLGVQATGEVDRLAEYSLASIPQVVALAISRSVASQTALRGHSVRSTPKMLAWFATICVTAALASLAIVLLYDLSPLFLILSVATPLSVTQDLFRSRAFGLHLASAALVSDSLWLVSMLVIAAGQVVVAGHLDLTGVLVAYAGGATLSAAYSLATWPHTDTTTLPPVDVTLLVTESGTIFGAAQIAQIVIGAVLPLSVLGVSRSAMILMAPVGLIASTGQALIVPRLDLEAGGRVVRSALRFGLLILGTGALAVLSLVVLPSSLLERTGFRVDATFVVTLVVLVVGAALGGVASTILVYVRVHWPVRQWLRSRLVVACLEPFVTIPLSLAVGAPGLASSSVTSNTAILVYILRRSSDTPGPSAASTSPRG